MSGRDESNGHVGCFHARRLSLGFNFVEDAVYVGLGLLLAGVASALLIAEIIYFIQYVASGQLSETSDASRADSPDHHFCRGSLHGAGFLSTACAGPGPFLVVSLIADPPHSSRNGGTAEDGRENAAIFHNATIELGLFTMLIVAPVISLHFLRPDDPNSAAQGRSNQRIASRPTDTSGMLIPWTFAEPERWVGCAQRNPTRRFCLQRETEGKDPVTVRRRREEELFRDNFVKLAL